jgi:hypothetical protein
VTGDREAQLVLDGGEEGPRRLRRAVVVGAARREDVADLLVEALLRRPDVPDATEQLVEVVGPARVLEPPGHRAPLPLRGGQIRTANVVILRQGRSDAGPSAFGWLHTLLDHNVEPEKRCPQRVGDSLLT